MGSYSEDVAIFWDYENCHAAAQLTGYEIVKKIRCMAHKFGAIKLFKAYVQLSDPATFSRSLGLRSELQSSGVSLTDCPHNGRKDVADKMMLVDMLAHAIDNSAPSTIVLISGDRDFAYAVSILRLRRYRVVVVSLPGVHASLKAQASTFLDWNVDVLGIDTTDDPLSANPNRYKGRRAIVSSPQTQVLPGKRSVVPAPASNKYDMEEIEVDIMDHLARGNCTRGPGSSAESQDENDFLKATSSTFRPQATAAYEEEYETSPPILKSPSRTESAPAILSKEQISLPSTVASQPPSYMLTSNPMRTMSPSSSVAKRQTPLPTLDPNRRPQDLIMLPSTLPGAVQHSVSPSQPIETPAYQILAEPLSPNDSSVDWPPLALSTLARRVPGSSAVPHSPVAKGNLQAAAHNEPKVVSPIFSLLVQRLEYHRSKGYPRPFRSGVAVELATQDNNIYRRAGAEKFGQYVAMAEKAGIVELGGREGGAWIGLRPEWYGAQLSW